MKPTMEQLVEWVSIIDKRVQNINDRTKIHTLDIKKLEKKIKELETLINTNASGKSKKLEELGS